MSRTHKRPAPVQGEINPERFDPMSWGAEARRPLSALVGIDAVLPPQNPEPQHVRVEAVKVTAALDLDAPAKTRRPGLPVPTMEPHVPEGHVDAMANVHSWDR